MGIASITPLCSWGKILCDMEFRIRPTSSGFVVVVVVVVFLNWKVINGTASIQLQKCTNILLYSTVVLGKEKAMFNVKNTLFTGCWVIPHFKSTWWVLQWNNDVIMCSCQYQVVLCWYLLIPIPIPILNSPDTLQEQKGYFHLSCTCHWNQEASFIARLAHLQAPPMCLGKATWRHKHTGNDTCKHLQFHGN